VIDEGRRTLIVTGGSRGIGAAVSRLAGNRGYSVAVNFRSNEAAAHGVVKEIRSSGGSAVAIRGDVARETDIIHLFQEAEQKLGPMRIGQQRRRHRGFFAGGDAESRRPGGSLDR
jgi:NAD(P)-dependent dehydrogenase (short-subunit alcohol dehydrogenase family)